MTTSADWRQMLRDLLCELYQYWGGDCADLGTNETAWIDTVTGKYSTAGAPTFGSPADKTKFLNTLTELETLLIDPAGTLSAADTQRLSNLIAHLRADLTPTT